MGPGGTEGCNFAALRESLPLKIMKLITVFLLDHHDFSARGKGPHVPLFPRARLQQGQRIARLDLLSQTFGKTQKNAITFWQDGISSKIAQIRATDFSN